MWGKEDGFYGIRQRCPKPHGEDHYPASSDLVHSGFRIWQPIRPPNGGLKASTNASLLELLIRYHNRLCSDSRDKSTLSQDSSGMEVLICGLTITRNWAESSRDAFQMIVKEMRVERSAAFPTTEYCGTNILDTGLEYSSRGAGFCTSKKCTFIFCSCWYACCGRFSAGTLIMNTKGFLWDEI